MNENRLEFDILRQGLNECVSGYRVFNNVKCDVIPKRDRENTAKSVLLRFDRLERNVNSLWSVCSKSLEIITRGLNNELGLDKEDTLAEIETCVRLIKIVVDKMDESK